MKRLPIVLTLVALIALAASIAYWVLQFYKPPQRPLAAAPVAALPDPGMDAAATLFGGQAATEVAANYTLTGVIADGARSVAIISANGAPAKALAIGKELAPGVSVTEVHPRFVMLSDGGVMKRIELAPDTKAATPMGGAAAAAAPAPMTSVPEPQMDAGVEAGHGEVGAHDQAPPPPSATNPPLNMGPVPQVARPA
ncbi:type II secretion system protein N, partial [Massilia terrae]